MNVLIIGAGVIGRVYGAHLADSGYEVAVLDHGRSTAKLADDGLCAHDVLSGRKVVASVQVVGRPDKAVYDLVLVSVRREQLMHTLASLGGLLSSPTVLVFGNNPGGRDVAAQSVPGQLRLGFPGIGGTLVDGVAEYLRIKQQPTAIEQSDDLHVGRLAWALEQRGFAIQRVGDMNGWLAYHAVLVSCVAAALYRCGSDPLVLGLNRPTLRLMCASVTEGFAALRRQGIAGLPRNLAILHSPALATVATRYWARTMRSPAGELCFAAHARRANIEMRALGDDVIRRVGGDQRCSSLRALLEANPAPGSPTFGAVH